MLLLFLHGSNGQYIRKFVKEYEYENKEVITDLPCIICMHYAQNRIA